MTYPSPGQPWNGPPEHNQPQYGGTPTPPLSGPPYNQPGYQSGYPQEQSYTTEPPMSGQPYQGQPYGSGYAQPQPPPQAYPPYGQQQVPSFVTPPQPSGGNRGGMLALVIGGIVILLILVGVGTAMVLRSGDDEPTANPTNGPASASASPSNAEYPARIDLPQTVAGLTKIDDPTLNKTANDAALQIKAAANADSAIAGYYAPSGDLTKAVGLVGATGRIADPEGELDSTFSGSMAVTGALDVDPGPLGGLMRCGNTANNGQALSVCGWADGGSLVLGIFVNRSGTDSAALFRQIRGEILKRG